MITAGRLLQENPLDMKEILQNVDKQEMIRVQSDFFKALVV